MLIISDVVWRLNLFVMPTRDRRQIGQWWWHLVPKRQCKIYRLQFCVSKCQVPLAKWKEQVHEKWNHQTK